VVSVGLVSAIVVFVVVATFFAGPLLLGQLLLEGLIGLEELSPHAQEAFVVTGIPSAFSAQRSDLNKCRKHEDDQNFLGVITPFQERMQLRTENSLTLRSIAPTYALRSRSTLFLSVIRFCVSASAAGSFILLS